MKLDIANLGKVLGASGLPDVLANRISINSKEVRPGDLFIAINRGHEFVAEALSNGAVAAVIDNEKYCIPDKTILVSSSVEALKGIGKYVKNEVGLTKVFGITGSVGKTTTRTWLNDILNKKFKSFSSIKNYNTIYGLPISLSLLERGTEFGVFEMGSSNPGEISELSRYLEPDIGIITNIFESHIGRFKNRDGLASEKISIIDGIKTNGTLIYNGDSEFSDKIKNNAQAKGIKYISVGFSKGCDFLIKNWGNIVKLESPLGNIEYEFNILGKHFSYITACIIATLYAMGIDIDDFLPFFKDLGLVEGRGAMQKYEYKGTIFDIIDDSYNASPSAVLASLEVLNSFPNKYKIVILGQMKELGEYEEYYHKLVAQKLNEMNLSQIFFIGDENLWKIINSEKKVVCFKKIDNFVIEKILEMVHNNSIVLLKGSHSIELHKVIDYIKCFTI